MEEFEIDTKKGKKLEELTQINLCNKKLTILEVDVINRCSKLEYLDLSRNRLKSLAGIFLPNLKFLNIEDNCISDVTFMSDVPQLETLYMDGNPLTIADRYIVIDQLTKLEHLDGKSFSDLKAKVDLYHAQLHSEIMRIFSSKYKSAMDSSTSSEQLTQQRRLLTREMLNRMSSCSSMPPKFHRYKVQDFVDKFFKDFEKTSSPQTPHKVQKCLEHSSPSTALKDFETLKLSSPTKKSQLASPFSSPSRSVKKENNIQPITLELKRLESSQSSPTPVEKRIQNLRISSDGNEGHIKPRRQLNMTTSDSAPCLTSPQKRKRECRVDQTSKELETRNISYDPYLFLRCHVPTNDSQDCNTQVWAAAFEMDCSDTGKTTDLVATCGGNIICFINCQTGHVVKRYKCESKTENLFSVSWTILQHKSQKQYSSVLAAAGNEKKIYLIHPSQLKCYSVFKAHSQAINCLKFHPKEHTWLFSGGNDSCVCLWDIGGISLPSYQGSHKKLATFELQGEIIQIALSLKYKCLFASSSENIAVWDLNAPHGTKKPSLFLSLPDSCKSEEKGVIDGLTLVSETSLAMKVSKSGKVILWDMSDVFQGGKLSKGKHQISPLAIFLWSDGDCDYSYLDACQNDQLIAGGDNAGRLWLYDTKPYVGYKNKDFSNDLSLPCTLLPWPKLVFDDETLSVKQKIIINSVQFSWNGDYLVACTDTNLVCIWKRTQ